MIKHVLWRFSQNYVNTQPFSHIVQTEWVKHMQDCLDDLRNFPQFTILSLFVNHIVNSTYIAHAVAFAAIRTTETR